MKSCFLIGIDEAGRGPIAGPVAVAAFSVIAGHKDSLLTFFKSGRVRDSKKLTAVTRERIFKELTVQKSLGKVSYAVSFASATVVDRKGISFATRLALARSLEVLGVGPSECQVLLDGSLKAPEEFTLQRTIIKGDEKEAVIALASIVAKVSRDRLMVRLAKKYPHYDLDIHKGYGTSDHYRKLKKHGLSPVHRKSFLKSFVGCKNSQIV